MFTVCRYWLKYGNEEDPTEVTIKEFETLEKAIAYGRRYAKGIRFLSFTITDEAGKEIYEQLADGTITKKFLGGFENVIKQKSEVHI